MTWNGGVQKNIISVWGGDMKFNGVGNTGKNSRYSMTQYLFGKCKNVVKHIYVLFVEKIIFEMGGHEMFICNGGDTRQSSEMGRVLVIAAKNGEGDPCVPSPSGCFCTFP